MNGVLIERAFVTICHRVMAMIISPYFTEEYQQSLWAKAVNPATMLTDTAINSVNPECPSTCAKVTSYPRYVITIRTSKTLARLAMSPFVPKYKSL